MGSYRDAQLLRERNVKVVGMISLKMLGYYDHRRGSQNYPTLVKWLLGWRLLKAGDLIGLTGFRRHRDFLNNVNSRGRCVSTDKLNRIITSLL